MFEGIGKYILALFIIYLISYVVKKIEMAKMFKKANVKSSKAYIPFVCTKELIDISHSDPKLFKLTLIPFMNISAYIKIYKDMLKTFGKDPKDAPLYVFFPMISFVKLGSGTATVQIHDYDINNEYLESQSMLYEPVIGEEEKPLYDMTDPGYYVPEAPKERIVYKVSRKNNLNKPSETIFDVNNQTINTPVQTISEVPEINNETSNILDIDNISKPVSPAKVVPENNDNQSSNVFGAINVKSVIPPEKANFEGVATVFTDKSLEPDKRQERVVEVEKKEEVIKNPITENVTGRPKMCPKCGAKLAPGAQTCFLCGTKL